MGNFCQESQPTKKSPTILRTHGKLGNGKWHDPLRSSSVSYWTSVRGACYAQTSTVYTDTDSTLTEKLRIVTELLENVDCATKVSVAMDLYDESTGLEEDLVLQEEFLKTLKNFGVGS